MLSIPLRKTEIYYYKCYGYNLNIIENGKISVYKVIIDSNTKRMISKKLLNNEGKVDLKKDSKGKLYFVNNKPMFSKVYSEFIEYCK